MDVGERGVSVFLDALPSQCGQAISWCASCCGCCTICKKQHRKLPFETNLGIAVAYLWRLAATTAACGLRQATAAPSACPPVKKKEEAVTAPGRRGRPCLHLYILLAGAGTLFSPHLSLRPRSPFISAWCTPTHHHRFAPAKARAYIRRLIASNVPIVIAVPGIIHNTRAVRPRNSPRAPSSATIRRTAWAVEV